MRVYNWMDLFDLKGKMRYFSKVLKIFVKKQATMLVGEGKTQREEMKGFKI